ncbi:MAG: PadR family transcriptional regulator [Oscillospiraceae bacterium]|nr:PadR family transcriptional regulator [Oscillospiraceae bacterium]
MDTQLKRGLLEISVLSVLNKGSSHGYQIIKDISPYIEISESTLYPILRRLESAGCLTVHSVEHNGRLRKIYDITPSGTERIGEFLDSWREVMRVYNYIEEGWNHEQN